MQGNKDFHVRKEFTHVLVSGVGRWLNLLSTTLLETSFSKNTTYQVLVMGHGDQKGSKEDEDMSENNKPENIAQ